MAGPPAQLPGLLVRHHKHFLRWCRTGVWQRMLRASRDETRRRAGRARKPSAAVTDPSSVKGTPVRGKRGFDDANKIDGIKRHIALDTGAAAAGRSHHPRKRPQPCSDLGAEPQTTRPCTTVRHVSLERGHTGQTAAQATARHRVTAEILAGPNAPTGRFRVQPRRSIAERTNESINHNRRLVHQHENTTKAHKAS